MFRIKHAPAHLGVEKLLFLEEVKEVQTDESGRQTRGREAKTKK